jgi:hypothetical protein
MWHLSRLSFENYRTFERAEEVLLAPLTVLIGRNSSGKSAIARLPLLLKRGTSPDAQAPLELEFDGHDFGASFVDVVYNRVPTRTITLGATVSDGQAAVDLSVAVGYWSEFQLQALRGFRIDANGQPLVDLEWNGQGDPIGAGLQYRDRTRGGRDLPVGLPRFTGMLVEPGPIGLWDDPLPDRIRSAIGCVRDALGSLVYLGPFRDAPGREMRLPEATVRDVGLRGGQAARALASDWLRQGATVLGRVSEFYRDHLGGWELDLERQGQSFSVVLHPPNDPSVAVNLRDAGVGLSQVLPVVVQHELDRAIGRIGGLDIVEQPELHLHPGVHGDLADLYIEAVHRSATRFLIETHSENFILRIRRRIAERSLQPTDVAIYWINDDAQASPRVQRIGLDEHGGVDSWPKGVFAEDLDEVRAIRAAQRDPARTGASSAHS